MSCLLLSLSEVVTTVVECHTLELALDLGSSQFSETIILLEWLSFGAENALLHFGRN